MIVSCICLLLAVNKISKFIKQKSDFNSEMHKVHAVSFCLFMAAASIYYVVYQCKNLFHIKHVYYESIFIICILLHFASQLCLCYIIH